MGKNIYQIKVHLAILLSISIIVFLISAKFDLFEQIHTFVEQHERHNFDELFMVLMVVTIYGLMWAVTAVRKLIRTNKEIEKIRDELIEENITKDKYHAIIAHDLKSPFNSLIGMSDLLLNQPERLGTDKGTRILESINQTSKTSFALLENLLQWSLIKRRAIQAHKERVNICEVISEVGQELDSLVKNKELKVIYNIPDKAFVYVDLNMVRLVIRNFLSNAIKYSHIGGIISIDIEIIDNKLLLQVVDQGVGITQNEINLLLKGRLKSARGTSNEKGTGFGMEVSQEFIAQNDGEFIVESTLGKGSTFGFTVQSVLEKK